MVIKTVDLWTERRPNDHVCFNGAFVDGFSSGTPFDEYKIIKNCNCRISASNANINITNKHNAIVFSKKGKPVRLLVVNGETDIDNCVTLALAQNFGGGRLLDKYNSIHHSTIDLQQKPTKNNCNATNEIDVGSCDRWSLLFNMLRGSYTIDNTPYGHYEDNQYEFLPDLTITYDLEADGKHFLIKHTSAFINMLKTRVIPIQCDSPLTNG